MLAAARQHHRARRRSAQGTPLVGTYCSPRTIPAHSTDVWPPWRCQPMSPRTSSKPMGTTWTSVCMSACAATEMQLLGSAACTARTTLLQYLSVMMCFNASAGCTVVNTDSLQHAAELRAQSSGRCPAGRQVSGPAAHSHLSGLQLRGRPAGIRWAGELRSCKRCAGCMDGISKLPGAMICQTSRAIWGSQSLLTLAHSTRCLCQARPELMRPKLP